MALSITNLKKGAVFQLEGIPYRVVEYNQKVMGRGGSIVNVRIKSLLDGRVLDKTFKGSEHVDGADVSNKPVQYLYKEGEKFYFMDPENYEQYELAAENVEDKSIYIKEGDQVTAQFFEGNIVGIELPKNVQLKVTYAENVVRGDTSNALTKDATVETGLKLKVPAFVKQGDIVSVDTSTGNYRERIR